MTNDQIKALIREVIAEGIDIDIPDAEIARVVKIETAELARRVEAIESRLSPAEKRAEPAPEPKQTATAKPSRVDVLRTRLDAINARSAKERAAA